MANNKQYYVVVGPRSTGKETAEKFWNDPNFWQNPVEQAGGKVIPADDLFFEPFIKQYISEYLKRRREEER